MSPINLGYGEPSLQGKNFRSRDFGFKLRFEKFWIDCDKKFRPNFLDFVIVSQFWPRNDIVSGKIYMGEIFDFEIFVLKYVSKHSESIPTKTIFITKIAVGNPRVRAHS